MRRRIFGLLGCLAMMAASTGSGLAGTQDKPTSLKPENDTAHAVEWSGTVGASLPSVTSSEDVFWFVADLGTARVARATALIHWTTSEDLDVEIRDEKGERVTGSEDLPGEDEYASFDVENGKRYQVVAVGYANAQTDYDGFLWVRSVSGRAFNGPGKLVYKKKDVLAKLDVPINIVFVGFDPAEVEANKQSVLDKLPPAFRPVIRTQSSLSGGTVRRQTATSTEVEFEPMEFRYKYNLITTPESYNRALFAAAKKATSSGEFQLAFDRDYIEAYNLRALHLRGPEAVVAPGSPMDFIDGFSLEDWVAAHPPAGLDFDLRKPANGYTYFVIDSFRPSYAGEYFNLNRYHNFKVMNELTTDPDSGAQSGFDWGRVWGGRYRFLMLDVGAAPNSWEAPVALANTKIFRLQGNGDSSLFDPPIWHYNNGTGGFFSLVGEDVQNALWFRFTRGYLYPPHPYKKYILAVNTWHDADAYAPWPSKLESLYKDKLVLAAYKDLIPYANFSGFSRFKYLSPSDPEQLAIDQGKMASVSRAPVPFAVNTRPVMQLVNANRAKYAPLERGAFTIPVINVVFQSLYTFSLPAIVGGVAEGEGGEPWGQLQNVNDRTKWPGATGEVTDSSGASHAPLVPDARVEGVDNVARLGFTATILHEAGHFVGLSHTHDAVAYDWTAGPVNEPTGYYNSLDWMYTTTASPMGYYVTYNRFEVLDKDNTWIGHAIEWLNQSQDDLADAYAALDSKRLTFVPSSVSSVQSSAAGAMNAAIEALQSGNYLTAVKEAQAARNLSEATLASAASTVLGSKIAKPKPVAKPKPSKSGLPATGVAGFGALAAVLLAGGAALGLALRRAR